MNNNGGTSNSFTGFSTNIDAEKFWHRHQLHNEFGTFNEVNFNQFMYDLIVDELMYVEGNTYMITAFGRRYVEEVRMHPEHKQYMA